MSKKITFSTILITVFAGVFALLVVSLTGNVIEPASAQFFIQNEPEVSVAANTLERISWASIIAGTLITLIFMFLLNLLGVAIGFTQINPQSNQSSADGSTLAMGGIVWVAVSNILALLVGGGIAAYFAGIPEQTDSILHGLMVWAVSGVITTLLVASGIGRLMSGLAGLIDSGLQLTGSAASSIGQTAGSALQGAGSIAGSAGNISNQGFSALMQSLQDSVQSAGSSVSNLTESAIESSPDVQNALSYQDLSFEEIKLEAQQMMREAGQNPEVYKEAARNTVDDVQQAAKQIIRHPEHADRILDITLQRVFRRGESVVSDVDRDSMRQLLTERTDMTPEQVEQQMQQWEQRFEQAKQQTRQAREVAIEKAKEFQQEAEQKAQELYAQAEQKAAELQREAEAKLQAAADEAEKQAREAAQAATDMFAKVAGGIAAAMIVGAIAAGLGGLIATPADLPDVPITEAAENLTPDSAGFYLPDSF